MKTGKIKPICAALLCAVLMPFVLLAYAESVGERPSDVPSSKANVSSLTAEQHCERVTASVVDAGFGDEASVTCDHEHAYIHSDSYPSHEMMTGIAGTNEQIPTPAPGYFAPIKFDPSFSGTPQTRDSSVAVAVNGIPIFDYSSGGEMGVEELYYHQPHLDTTLIQQLDICGGHTGRGDDYHYHELPSCMLEQMDNKDDNPIIAWAFDGFPMYGNNNPDGSAIGENDLDVCNGQLDDVFGYRYHTSEEQPYIIQCLVGEVGDLSTVPTISMDRPSGVPVLVENLTFDHDGAGTGLMTYEHEGEDYYLKTAATDNDSCFDIEWKTITNGGVVESGEYCHTIRTGARTGGGMGGPPGDRGMGGPSGGGMGAR